MNFFEAAYQEQGQAETALYPTGFELKLRRIQAGPPSDEVAALLAVDPARLSEIESGRRRASPSLLPRLLEILDDQSREGHGGRQA